MAVAEETDAQIVAKLLGVEEIPALTRQRLLHDVVLYHIMNLVVNLYRENKRLLLELGEARIEARRNRYPYDLEERS